MAFYTHIQTHRVDWLLVIKGLEVFLILHSIASQVFHLSLVRFWHSRNFSILKCKFQVSSPWYREKLENIWAIYDEISEARILLRIFKGQDWGFSAFYSLLHLSPGNYLLFSFWSSHKLSPPYPSSIFQIVCKAGSWLSLRYDCHFQVSCWNR